MKIARIRVLVMAVAMFCSTAASFATEAVFFPLSGRVNIPQLIIAGDPARTVYDIDLQQIGGSSTFALAAVSPAIAATDKFTSAWLAGKTLYQVWFGNGSSGGVKIENVPVVLKLQFNSNNTVVITGLLNEDSGNTTYHVDNDGRLLFGDDTDEWNKIVCGSTDRYIKTHFYERGSFDNVDLFFFDENDAMTAAEFLTNDFPRCPTAP